VVHNRDHPGNFIQNTPILDNSNLKRKNRDHKKVPKQDEDI